MNPMILRNLSYGMYAIGVKGKKRPSACIVNTVVKLRRKIRQLLQSV